MEKKLIATYKYNELAEAIKQKFRDSFEPTTDWYESVVDDWTEKIGNRGFYHIAIAFTGFWSQGDGASFTGNLDLEAYLKTLEETDKILTYNPILFALRHNHIGISESIIKRTNSRYVHEHSTYLYLEYEPYVEDTPDNFEELFLQLTAHIKEHIVKINRKVYKALETEYNNQTTVQIIDEYFTNLDKDYFIDGVECDYQDESAVDFKQV